MYRGHPNDKIGIVENANVDEMEKFGREYLYHKMFKERYYWWKHTGKGSMYTLRDIP